MFILSQGKYYLVSLDNGRIELENNRILFRSDKSSVELGVYLNNYVAIEVLNYIVSAIERDKKVYVMP